MPKGESEPTRIQRLKDSITKEKRKIRAVQERGSATGIFAKKTAEVPETAFDKRTIENQEKILSRRNISLNERKQAVIRKLGAEHMKGQFRKELADDIRSERFAAGSDRAKKADIADAVKAGKRSGNLTRRLDVIDKRFPPRLKGLGPVLMGVDALKTAIEFRKGKHGFAEGVMKKFPSKKKKPEGS